MAISKDNSKKWTMIFADEDFTPVTEESIITAIDPNGRKVGIDIWTYAYFFFEKIQNKSTSGYIYIDGIRIDKYKEYFAKGKKLMGIYDFLEDSTCYGLQQEMQELHATHINWVALYGLCMYIREIIDRRLAILLKPTIKETLDEIGEVNEIDSISFKLKNGDIHASDFRVLKELIVKSLQECNNETIGFHKIVRKVDIYTKEYAQTEFVKYISKFFHERFTEVIRRKNSYLTVTEQKIICYLLKFFQFAPEVVQESRFRQLFNSKYTLSDHFMPLSIPGMLNTKAMIYIEFVPYSVWKQGKINPLKSDSIHSQHLKSKMTMDMGDVSDISDLLEVIDGMFG